MRIYDSIEQKKVEFKPIKENQISMYVCGPTVYSDIHIGNARPIVFFDVVRRFFETQGYQVNYVSNITDVDDKIIARSKELEISENILTDRTTREFKRVLKELNVEDYYDMPSVVDYMSRIIEYIQRLIDRKYAYVVDGQVYFDVSKDSSYGIISKRNILDMKDSIRIDKDPNKKNPQDFLLWKKTSNGIKWNSPWSSGRPGWHSECACMIDDIFKDTIDIHGGGMDLKFPHHENENAQSLATGKKLANYWIHNGFINIDNEKMSKSIGNVMLVKELLQEYGSNFIRLLLLKNSYSQPVNITDDLLYQVGKMEQKIMDYMERYQIRKKFSMSDNIGDLKCTMEDDFNTANFISIFEKKMADESISEDEKSNILSYFSIVLGLKEYDKVDIPTDILELVKKREEFKKQKEFEKADEIRDKVFEMGYQILDTREGSKCQKIN